MSRRRPDIKYTAVAQSERCDEVDSSGYDAADSGFSDAQYAIPATKVPWKAIALASFLCVAGTISLVAGIMIVTGHIDIKYSDRFWPLIILGFIMFIPGAYHVRIAYCSYLRRPGYSFNDIPEFD